MFNLSKLLEELGFILALNCKTRKIAFINKQANKIQRIEDSDDEYS